MLTLDLPGHGRSEMPANGTFSIDLFARAVEAVRAEAGAEKVVLVGHSMGALVVGHYARLFPQRLAALVAVDGPLPLQPAAASQSEPAAAEKPPEQAAPAALPPLGGPEGLQGREKMIRMMFTPHTPSRLQERILDMMLKAPEATAVGAMAAMSDPVWSDKVIAVPVLAVLADKGLPPATPQMKSMLPDLEVTRMKGSGHFLMMERPAEFNALLDGFLRRIGF